MWSLGLLDDLVDDTRYAARVLRRDVGFTAAAVLTLALGIGANTAVFGIVDAVLLRPLPYAHPEQLVSVWTAPAGTPSDRNPTSLPDLRDWQRQQNVFSGIAGYAFNRYDLNGPDGATFVRAVQGTGELYDVLGARPLLGRLPRPDEERAPVATISYRLWQERFGGDRSAIGRPVDLNGIRYTVIGVMPAGFHFPTPDIDLWMTMYSIVANPTGPGPNPWLTSRSLRGYRVVARLAEGHTMAQAEAAMNAIEHRLGTAYPEIDGGTEIHLQSVRDDSVRGVQRALWMVFGTVLLILLLACINVAHLLLARLASRGRELAVRRALGAHRGRIVRQLATESLLLALIGGAVGVAVAVAATRALVRLAPGDIPRLENVGIDGPALGFALLLSTAVGLLFGVLPALLDWGRDLHHALRAHGKSAAGGAHGNRTRALLTAMEVAFAVVVLVGAGLMLRSFVALTTADLGVRPDGVSVASLTMVGPRYQAEGARTRTLDEVLNTIRAIPGVTAAGASSSMPPSRIEVIEGFELTGKLKAQPGHEPTAIYVPMTSGYLEALHIPVERGRDFDSRDVADAPPVALVSRALAQRYFPGVDPVGQRIDVSGVTRTIVGVTGDAVYEGVRTPIKPVIYVPFAQAPFPGVWLAIRTTGSDRAVAAQLPSVIRRIDSQLPVHRLRTLEAMVGEAVVRPRFHAWLLATFGALALVLAAVGIYGVIAYGVTQRRPEIGIRLAIGAPTSSILAMVLRAGMLPVCAGIAAGVLVALLASRVVAGLLYGVAPTDALTFAGVAALLAGTGLAAAYVPARRAARVDPLTAIRAE